MNRAQPFDLLVLGGGVSGAGVALAAARRGLQRVLLVERHDFASGASSRSSKLVHGGLRYLAQGQIGLTRESVHAREALIAALPGLVRRLPFVLTHRPGVHPGRLAVQSGLWLYDQLAGRRTRGYLDAAAVQALLPGVAAERGASRYEDASTDDARLTLRLLQDARRAGVQTLNHTELLALERDADGAVRGARLRDADGFERAIDCRCVIAAAGAQLGPLAQQVGLALPPLRPLRGSHLLLPLARLPLPCAVAWNHPQDGRPVFAYPWLGGLLVGTTDVDQPDPLRAPCIAREEQDYLLAALNHAFPQGRFEAADIRSTWAGVRPVIASEDPATPPSQESREHLVQAHQGLVALTGGKLTTFAAMADAALKAAQRWLPPLAPPQPIARLLEGGGDGVWGPLAHSARQGAPLPGTGWREGELAHSLQHEQVRHLDDLLLRRSRVGLLLPRHGEDLLPLLAEPCQRWLGWDGARFAQESERYRALVREQHSAA